MYGRRKYRDGDIIFSEGERGGEAYMVRSGQVRLIKEVDGTPDLVDTVNENSMFGEMAIISDMPRMATAVAVGETVCLSLSREGFQNKLKETDENVQNVVHFLINYAREVLPFDMLDDPSSADEQAELHNMARDILTSGELDRITAELEPTMSGLLNSLAGYAKRRLPPSQSE